MRLVKVSAPEGSGAKVAETAFTVGIGQVSFQKANSQKSGGEAKAKDIVDIQTSTPKAKKFIDALLAADYYDAQDFSINVRQPRFIISNEKLSELTVPLVEPEGDILEELWQFSHITIGFVGRHFIAGCLLAYGLIQQNTLTIIAGLLFLTLLPLMLSISFGSLTKQWRLVGQGALAFVVALALLFGAGAAIAAISSPPLKYDEFGSIGVTFLMSLGIAIAAVLANTDDVGRRELIGLAATSLIAIVPTWFGIYTVFAARNAAPNVSENELMSRALSLGVSILTIIVVTFLIYALLGMKSGVFNKLKNVSQ